MSRLLGGLLRLLERLLLSSSSSEGAQLEFRIGGMQFSDNARSLAVAVFYWCTSISMNFLNKVVVSSYEFNFPFFIMVCQMTVTLLILDSLRIFNVLSLPAYSLKDGREFLPASLCFALHATLSLSALHGMNIPMYGAIKRCTPLVSLVLSVTLLRKQMPSKFIITSILLITGGCLVAGLGDLEFDRHAYTMGLLSVFAQGGYLTLVQRSSENKKSTVEMVHINSYNTLPFFIGVSLLMREPALIAVSDCIGDTSFYLVYVILILAGCVLTYSQFLCAAVCSALTASLVGVAKSILQTFIGFFTFGGVRFNIINVIGIIMNTLGGCMYSYIKFKEGQQKGPSPSNELNLPNNASSCELLLGGKTGKDNERLLEEGGGSQKLNRML